MLLVLFKGDLLVQLIHIAIHAHTGKAGTARGLELLSLIHISKKMAEDLTDYLSDHGVKVKYMHHEVDTFERVELMRDLRKGTICLLYTSRCV